MKDLATIFYIALQDQVNLIISDFDSDSDSDFDFDSDSRN